MTNFDHEKIKKDSVLYLPATHIINPALVADSSNEAQHVPGGGALDNGPGD
jgi:hypothetical protein